MTNKNFCDNTILLANNRRFLFVIEKRFYIVSFAESKNKQLEQTARKNKGLLGIEDLWGRSTKGWEALRETKLLQKH